MTSDAKPRVERWRDAATLAIVLAGALLIPLAFHPRDAYDTFRLPKALLFRAEAVLLVAVHVAALLLGARLPRLNRRDPWLLLPLAAFGAMVVVTLTSSKPVLSATALETAAATLIVFLATVAAARDRSWLLLAGPLAAALANAVLVVIEEAGLWMPFGVRAGIPHHLQCNALVGNPNEVGGYLGAALLTATAVLVTRAGRRGRGWNVLAVAVLAAGLVASRTLTGLIAFFVAAVVMLGRSSPRRAWRAVAGAALCGAIVLLLVAPLRTRAAHMIRAAERGEYNTLITERGTPFVAAWSMFTSRPLTGVGPGAFGWHYYDAKLRAELRHPSLRLAYNRGVNYGEVHNDHLQVLAEGGLVGYAAFVALFAALAAIPFRAGANADDPRQQFARTLALPLAVFWVVLSLAQFPLETTVVRGLLVHLAALCVAWRNS